MYTPPTDPTSSDVLDEETKRILNERLKTIDEDKKMARSAKEVLAELRADLRTNSLKSTTSMSSE